jgi:hypothetical protein
MAKNVWTISANDLKGGNLGSQLLGCHVTENLEGNGYEFTQPDIKQVLGTTAGNALPAGSFAFSGFSYRGANWIIAVFLLDRKQITGVWGGSPQKEGTDDESGTWTAQAGSGEDRGKSEAARKGAHKPRARGAGRG